MVNTLQAYTQRGAGGAFTHPYQAGQIISKSCLFTPETEFTDPEE